MMRLSTVWPINPLVPDLVAHFQIFDKYTVRDFYGVIIELLVKIDECLN